MNSEAKYERGAEWGAEWPSNGNNAEKRKGSKKLVIAVSSIFVIASIALIFASWKHGIASLPFPFFKRSIAATTVASCNYNPYYGIPNTLPVINDTILVNHTELDLNTNFNKKAGYTTRKYTLNITQAVAAPDGFQKPMILINNQSPGPLIEANINDILQITVNNLMSNWSTTVHWHGIDQKNTIFHDGVAAITQCGIPPGQSFTYVFNVTGQAGTFWYHSHLSTQYADGMYGPLIVHDSTDNIVVDDEKIVFIGDNYHTYSSIAVLEYLNPSSAWSTLPGVEPLPDNVLLNGRNKYNCSVTSSTYPPVCPPTCTGGELYSTSVKSGSTNRIRLISHSTFLSFYVTIDNHTFDIVELDGVQVNPIRASGVFLNTGQRYSLIVNANQTVGNYYIRASVTKSCFIPTADPNYSSAGLNSTNCQVLGILSYDNTNPLTPTIGSPGNTINPNGGGCSDMPFDLAKPVSPKVITPSPGNSFIVDYSFANVQHSERILMNSTAWAPLENNATMWNIIDPNYAAPPDQQILLVPDTNFGIQLVVNSLDSASHGFHMHGHDVAVYGWGEGRYDPTNSTNTTTWNFNNPMRRDTVTIPGNSHVVLRWCNNNPGIWVLHCHIAWHTEAGMVVQFAERVADMATLIRNMDPATRAKSLSFCGVNDDQAYGTYPIYLPPSK